MSLLLQGTPTNNPDGAASGFSIEDPGHANSFRLTLGETRFQPVHASNGDELRKALGLPTAVPAVPGLDAATLLTGMQRDKKAHGGLTFVLPGPDGLQLVDDPPLPALEQALRAVGVAVG